MESIYFNSIIPSVVYNIVVWGSVSPSLMEDIERIHLRAIRIVCKLPMTTSADEIKKLRQWNPISLYYVKRLLVLTYQSYHSLSTEDLNILISKVRINYRLRNSLNVEGQGQDLKLAGLLLNTGLPWHGIFFRIMSRNVQT